MAKKRGDKQAYLVTLRSSFEKGSWVCTCLEFGVSSFGKDVKAVTKEVMEMTFDHIQTLKELGELENFVERHRVPVVEITRGKSPPSRRIRVPIESPDDALSFSSVRMLQPV